MIINECLLCVCVPVARVPLSNTHTHTRGWRRSSRSLARLPGRHPAPGSRAAPRSAAALKEGLAGRAWWGARKAPKATRFCTEPWQNHNDSSGSAPRGSLFTSLPPRAFHRRRHGPVTRNEKGQWLAAWLAPRRVRTPNPSRLIVYLTRSLFVGKLTVIETEERIRDLDRSVVGHVTVDVKSRWPMGPFVLSALLCVHVTSLLLQVIPCVTAATHQMD